MADTNRHLGDALAYHDFIPVGIIPQNCRPEPLSFGGINELNEEVLHNILFLEKYHNEVKDDDSDNAAGLAHIDLKLNLILDLMLKVYASQLTIPPPQSILLTSTRFTWTSEKEYQSDDMFFIDIYLSRRFPKPLRLFGVIDRVERDDSGHFCYHITLEELSVSVQELLERFIFLKHRRMIASVRRDNNN